ncbi:TauD/TfdA family dioxygenase, partial [Pseudomonas viridiflava]|uniref:TauD/TfdA family dioxygenase n=1 Tax=Pseudomonas viridiflava TaxID=33069 RepID=UPI0019D2BC1D
AAVSSLSALYCDDPRAAVSADAAAQAGRVVVLDNRRTLHARNAFDPATGVRHFQGSYVDRDELLSRILVLQR